MERPWILESPGQLDERWLAALRQKEIVLAKRMLMQSSVDHPRAVCDLLRRLGIPSRQLLDRSSGTAPAF